uniref:Predicted nucleoside ABC transporter, ATP-binding component n=1 Tax=uncultured Thiotrichaceae bacterium TaxID=298394 RepID=A0A6S6TJI6_9GAMM|nr:MAG: Predicted nucleoside ABC transporter, ATP-binding component [uncultured Thiotrichaceae bacterium]
MEGSSPYALELINISKSFGPVKANQDINLPIVAGDIHGIIGENGAGKSTLMSIIYGFYEADSGEIRINGDPINIRNSQQALAAGIGMVHQHFMLVDNFTVLENVMLGAEGGALLREGEQQVRKSLSGLATTYQLEVPLDTPVEQLSVGVQQRVEILKALYRKARILILDEPTGVLTPQEATDLFRILRTLKDDGVTIVLITHKLHEIMAITDHVSVIRQGRMVAHRKTSETNMPELAELMVGRKVRQNVDRPERTAGEPLLQVENLSVDDEMGVRRVKQVSFQVAAGEVVGIAGVSGNGQSQLLEALSGIVPPTSGQIQIASEVITADKPSNPARVRELGAAHVPEDRHRMGLVLPFSAYQSAVLGYHHLPRYNGSVLQDHAEMQSEYRERAESFDIRPRDPYLRSSSFSGGNQQKIVLAREMEADPDILLIGQPTRGVDIGAIEFIHQQIMDMRNAGKAVLLVSVELEEIMSLSDRILVMCDGMITGEVAHDDANEQTLGLMMANADAQEVA